MEAQRHFGPATTRNGSFGRLQRLTATEFVQRVVIARQDGDWVCFKGGHAGIVFCLANDRQRHARILFERDRSMGPDGNAAPTVFFGVDEHSLDELAADDLTSWVLHLRGRRNSNEADIAFIRALFSVLKL